MKNKLTTVSAIISVLILICSCGAQDLSDINQDVNPVQTTNTSDDEVVTTSDPLAFLPEDYNLGGEKITILYGQNVMHDVGVENEVTYGIGDFEQGDIIADAVYRRTKIAEERLGCEIVSPMVDWDDGTNKAMKENALSGDSAYNAVIARVYTLGNMIKSGYLADLRSISSLNLDNSWWDRNVNTGCNIMGRQYIATGDINYYDDYSITCMAFNKNRFDDRGIVYPYDLVRDGKWTFDEFYKTINDTAADLDGNGIFDENDFYGYVANAGFLSSTLIDFGEGLVIEDGNGNVILNRSESIVTKAQTVADKLLSNDSFLVEERKLGYDKGDKILPSGQALMSGILIGSVTSFRQNMDDDFGVLPNPKWNEEQDGYKVTISQHWSSCVAVPSNADTDKAGYILETLGALSYDTVTSAVVEQTVKTKSSRDEESVDMLDIIFESKTVDMALIFDDWGIYNLWMGMTKDTDPKIVSTLEKSEKSTNNKIAKFIEAVNGL